MTEPAASPFASATPSLAAMGYSCVPLIPASVTSHRGRGKAPGTYMGGHWQGLDKWQRRREAPLQGFELGLAMKAPGANVGVVLGTVARPNLFVIAIDVDAEDADTVDAIVRCLPASPMVKRGAKGRTLFYAAPKTVTSRAFDDHRIPRDAGIPRRLVDILTGFATKQTVCPPSVHPDGQVYAWLAGPVAASELPLFDDDAMTVLEETLQQFGYDPDAARGGRGERKAYVPGDHADTSGDAFDVAKRAALANIGAWIHDVDNLHGLRPARGGFEAVSLMRDSSSGQPVDRRKRNLSIQPNGIRDFGTDETFSAIDLVAHHNGLSVGEALTWLEERLGLGVDDSVIIDLRPPPEKTTAPNVPAGGTNEAASSEKVAGETEAKILKTAQGETHGTAEMPAHLLRVPGLVGHIADWITATSRKPQPVLSLAAALGIVGTVAGRKFAGPTDSATHLYFLCTAGTGAGKNAPKKAAAQLLQQAGMKPLLGPGSFSSGSALVQHVSRYPASLCVMDEFGVFMGKLNAKNNSTHERAISGEMRQFWTLSFEDYQPPCWANSATRQTLPPIPAPALSIMGLTTPDELYSVLQGADVLSGFLNRFTLFATASNPADRDPVASVFDPPQQLVDGLRSIAESVSPLEAATMHGGGSGKPPITVPWEDGPDGEARAVFRALQIDMESRTDNEAMRQRTAEIAVRMATIVAIGVSGAAAKVSAAEMRWAAEVATWSTERLIADIAEHMVESDHQMRAKRVLRIIRQHPTPIMSRTDLCRKLNNSYRARELDEALQGLFDTGQVEKVAMNKVGASSQGRPAFGYRAL